MFKSPSRTTLPIAGIAVPIRVKKSLAAKAA